MSRFNVSVEQTIRGTIEVEAETQEQAERVALAAVKCDGLEAASGGCFDVENTTVYLTLEVA